MDIGFNRVNRMISPQTLGEPEEAAGSRFRETPVTGSRSSGELVKVAGEERVDEAALRRDDDLGNLVSKAFDPSRAAAALPPLGLG